MRLSSRTKFGAPVGLGQCIKTLEVNQWKDIGFLSKTFVEDSQGQVFSIPDVNKLLYQKVYYTGYNRAIHANPSLYTRLKRFSVTGLSKFLEYLFEAQVLTHEDEFKNSPDQAGLIDSKDEASLWIEEEVLKHTQKNLGEFNYEAEDYIND